MRFRLSTSMYAFHPLQGSSDAALVVNLIEYTKVLQNTKFQELMTPFT